MGPYQVPFPAPLARRRRTARLVRVGNVGVGGGEPIRIQSMLTCNTWDVERVLEEMRGLADAGCEIVRMTVPSRRDLEALPEIRRRMAAAGLAMPLVADIHFNPKLAVAAAAHVEKVRINPGNYVDQKRFELREYSDAQYAEELARVEEALLPLIAALKSHGRALRVGVNHGSLSDRILNRYGDNPRGMVECAMEYLRVLASHGFHDTIVSMKSSNPLVVIRAYRLLAQAMEAEGMDYPLHLGVTEAGDGPEGRIKSAIGIGALLMDGLGDTVRVSLTEAAVNEIPAARELVNSIPNGPDESEWPEEVFLAPPEFQRRGTRGVRVGAGMGEHGGSVTVGGGAPVAFLALEAVAPAGGDDAPPFDAWLPASGGTELPASGNPGAGGWRTVEQALTESGTQGAVLVEAAEVDGSALGRLLKAGLEAGRGQGAAHLLILSGDRPLYPLRRLVGRLEAAGLDWPVGALVPDDPRGQPPLGVAAAIGSLAADGLLDVLVCPTADPARPMAEYCRTLLQGARLRTYKAEFISCPSCGRTLFDLEETTARIKARTGHLKGVKIGIMGCVVNGPGEMADADFGYVGGAPGRINLFKGQTCVERGIPAEEAVERLVELIREHGAWVEA